MMLREGALEVEVRREVLGRNERTPFMLEYEE